MWWAKLSPTRLGWLCGSAEAAMCHAGCWLRGKTLPKMKVCWRDFLSTSVWRGSRGLCGSPAGQQISLAQECLLQVSRVPVEGCEAAVMREGGGGGVRRKTMENLRRDTRLPAAVTQLELSSWFEALNSSFSIYHVNLRGGTSFALPVPLVSLDSSTPSVQTSYLSPLPLSHTAASPSLWSGFTSRSPPRFPPERLHVHRSRWEPHVLCLGTPRPPRSDGNALVGGSLKSRPRINQFDDVGAEWLTEWSQPCTCVLPLRSPFKSSDWRGGTESWPLLSGDSYSRCPASPLRQLDVAECKA